MDEAKLKEGQRLFNKIQDYSEYKDKVYEILIHPCIPVCINQNETPLSRIETCAIRDFIVKLCEDKIEILKKEFEDL